MKNLIPHFIQDRYQEGKYQGRLRAYTMFIDLSGFTPLTEELMMQGNRGAEQLSNILNEIFAPLVNLVYARGGFIPYFAGDAFTAIFPLEKSGMDAQRFLNAAFKARNLFRKREYQFGEFTIGLRVSLSYGEVEWGIVGSQEKSFYFRGYPIDQCAQCQLKMKKYSEIDIAFDHNVEVQLRAFGFQTSSFEDGFYFAENDIELKAFQPLPQPLPEILDEIGLVFFPKEVIEYDQEGEFRTIVSVFISFEGVGNHDLLDTFTSKVLEEIHNFSGYFKEIDFGDKGGVLVGFFGAPVSFENNIDRALQFVLALQAEVEELQERSGLQYKIGITIGTAYTGIVGGEERCQYAAVGNRVNLAARLMTYADWGEVLVDEEIQKNRRYQFQHKGDIQYKGIQGFVPTFILVGKNFDTPFTDYTGRMVGRYKELNDLIKFAAPLFDDKAAGVSYIYGEAGIGKSRLAHEFRKTLLETKKVAWHICQSDQILKKPFNPFIYFLRSYFVQSQDSTPEINRDNFESRFHQTYKELESKSHEDVQVVKKELQRTKSVLGALVGISYPNSLWEQLDARGRYQNTIAAIINLLIAEALIHPVVIELEDGHWLDENSTELLHELIRQIYKYPILLVITSRYKDDGSKPVLIDASTLEVYNLPKLELDLNLLHPKDVRTFAEKNLNGEISEEFYELLLKTSNSNPFYLQQILEYFSESNLVEFQDGKWHIKDKNIKLSNSITGILTARIDRLSTLVKETVKAAAVIGREFEIPVLTEVMKVQDSFSAHNGNANVILKEQVKTAERGQIWLAMNELRYIFRHSLLHEAVYGMQLRTRLRQLHQLIAEAIERLYANKLEERFVDLAFHYEQAGVFDKTCEYLRKAADFARNNYQNQQALDYYERLLIKLNQEKDSEVEIKTLLKKGKVLELIGEWDQCQVSFEKALSLAKKSRDALLLGQANNSLGHLLMLKGDYVQAMNYLRTATQLFELIEDKIGIANVYGNIGNLFFRQGRYDEAKAYFHQSIERSKAAGRPGGNAQIVANLGLTYMNKGNFDEGIRVFKEKLSIEETKYDKQGSATLYTNLGIVYFEKGDYDAALESYEKGLALAEELGNKLLTAISVGCIGSVYERKGNYDSAMINFERDLEIVEELGDKQGIAIVLGLIGELHSFMGNFHKAIEYLQKNLMLCEELGYQKGIAKAVNTLGDVFYFTQQYERSLYFYDRAIEVTKNIGNKLVLGSSLVEKGLVLIKINDFESLQTVYAEALEIAEELGNPDLLFEATILGARTKRYQEDLKKAESILMSLLKEKLNRDQEAEVYYELWRIFPKNKTHREKAFQLYQEVYKETPRYSYRTRLDALNVKLTSESK